MDSIEQLSQLIGDRLNELDSQIMTQSRLGQVVTDKAIEVEALTYAASMLRSRDLSCHLLNYVER